MAILITGGAGFIGQNLARELIAKGEKVLSLDLKACSVAGINSLVGSVADPASHWKWVDDRGEAEDVIDGIFHLASMVGVEAVSAAPIKTIDSIIDGTRNITKLAAAWDVPLITMSTSEVYGDRSGAVSEEDPCSIMSGHPRWAYASAKLTAEHIALHGHSKTIVVRPFNVAGNGQSQTSGVVANFVKQALAGEPLTIYGSGSQQRAFCHVQDFVEALIVLMEAKLYGHIFNIGNPSNKTTILDLAEWVKRDLSSDSEIEYEWRDIPDIGYRQPDISFIKTATGWIPRQSLGKIIEDAAA